MEEHNETELRLFDLNIQRILEHWTVALAIREIIANALDEYILTATAPPHISQDSNGAWHIRDYGRGLRYEHLIQNENEEKLTTDKAVIGKFGVGLKDALATFDRHQIRVQIRSAHSEMTLTQARKSAFADVTTLHVAVAPPSDPQMVGTDILLNGVSNADVQAAKDYFLLYRNDDILERTRYGEVLRHSEGRARIYVHGVCVAEEDNFLFSYNITSLTEGLRKALNRERNYVGRGAYAERVQDILLTCISSSVADLLATDMNSFASGKMHDELQWFRIACAAASHLQNRQQVLFISAEDERFHPGLSARAQKDGYEVVMVSEEVHKKLRSERDAQGKPLCTTEVYLGTQRRTKVEGRLFDLNIQRVLEHWSVVQAIREVIANALDEHMITKTAVPRISQDSSGIWHIRDYGRGLRYEHLVQNESDEKLSGCNPTAGKFGVGLKDALATFDRHQIGVQIRSAHGEMTLRKAFKYEFADVVTLHVEVKPPLKPTMVGTDVLLSGISEQEIQEAKDYFLFYRGDKVLESTRYGDVLQRSGKHGRIYVHGICVAEEENFLFSYNITSLTEALRRALNRERSHVGRGAYTERVQDILLACTSTEVTIPLAEDLHSFATGKMHDELQWAKIYKHASSILQSYKPVVFSTPAEEQAQPGLVTTARKDGYEVVTIPYDWRDKLVNVQDKTQQPIRLLDVYKQERNESFQFQFVVPDQLTTQERNIFEQTPVILQLLNQPVLSTRVKEICISETMREGLSQWEEVGLWMSEEGRIVIKRSQLCSLQSYMATLLHELAHALSGQGDATMEFEAELTELLGCLATAALQRPATPEHVPVYEPSQQEQTEAPEELSLFAWLKQGAQSLFGRR